MHSGQINPHAGPSQFVIVLSDNDDEDSDTEDSPGGLGRSIGYLDLASSSDTATFKSYDTPKASSSFTSLHTAARQQNVKRTSEVRQAAVVDTPAAAVIDLTLDDKDDIPSGKSDKQQVFQNGSSVTTPSLSCFKLPLHPKPVASSYVTSECSSAMVVDMTCSTNTATPYTLTSPNRSSFTKDWIKQLPRISPAAPTISSQYDRGDGAYRRSNYWNTFLRDSDHTSMEMDDVTVKDCGRTTFGLHPIMFSRGETCSAMDTTEDGEQMETDYDVNIGGFGDTLITYANADCRSFKMNISKACDEEKMDIDNDEAVLPVILAEIYTCKRSSKSKEVDVKGANGKYRKRRRFDRRDVDLEVRANKRRRPY